MTAFKVSQASMNYFIIQKNDASLLLSQTFFKTIDNEDKMILEDSN